MRWRQVQGPLRDGFQAFRTEWPDDTYVELTEGGRHMLYRDDDDHEEAYRPTIEDESADDWQATGPGGE